MRKILLIIPVILIGYTSWGQETGKMKKFDWSRMYYGGNLWIAPSNYGFSMLIAPEVGYYVKPNLLLAGGISYTYIKTNKLPSVNKYNITSYKLFSRYYFQSKTIPLLNNLFAHAEYESMFTRNRFYYNDVLQSTNRDHFNNVYVGGGYIQRIGGRLTMYILILYNLNYDPDSPVGEIEYRVGFGI